MKQLVPPSAFDPIIEDDIAVMTEPGRPSSGYRTPPTYEGPPPGLPKKGTGESRVHRILREAIEADGATIDE